jgi:transposase
MGKQEPILDYCHERITNGFTEGCYTKIKMLELIYYGIRHIDDYRRKMLLKLVSTRSSFHTI